jgi:toxin CcdB
VARFDVYRNIGPHAETTPYLLDVQSNLLHALASSVVVPMRRLNRSDRSDRFASAKLHALLTPVFDVEGQACLLETPKLAAVPRRLLKDCVVSLAHEQSRITGALDFLFQGY